MDSGELLVALFFLRQTEKKCLFSYHLLLSEFLNKLLLEGLYQITEIKACSLTLFVHTFYGKLFQLVSKEFRLVHKLIPRSSTDVENQQKMGPFDTPQLCKKIRIYLSSKCFLKDKKK